jgi:predicted DNA-binding transcriptional regulator AlpA
MNGDHENGEKGALLPMPVTSEDCQPATLRISALAKRFDVCKKTIGRHVEHGLLPPPDFYVGRFPHWKASNIEKWIEIKKHV